MYLYISIRRMCYVNFHIVLIKYYRSPQVITMFSLLKLLELITFFFFFVSLQKNLVNTLYL